MIVLIYSIYIRKKYEINKEEKKNNVLIRPNKNKLNRHKIKIKKKKKTKNVKNNLVYMDISISNHLVGKIIIKLYDDIVPITCKNFRELCSKKHKMSYKGSIFHRIISDFMIQGGDITQGNGTGGMSIYGKKFKDENFNIPHHKPYLLSMANSGKNTNGSQFFITTTKTPHLDGKHVVFGEVVDGFKVVNKLNNIDTDENDRPFDDVVISNCGIYKHRKN